MGTNNRARRAAKAKAKARPRRSGPRRPAEPDAAGHVASSPETASPADVARLVQRCSRCGSADLEWTTAGALVDRVPDDARERAAHGAAFFGEQADSWLCRQCGTFGLMST